MDRFRVSRVWKEDKNGRRYKRYIVVDYRTMEDMTKPVTRPTAYAKARELNAADPPPTPVKRDSRICFGIAYFSTETDADRYAKDVRRRGLTYNGGYFHGAPCGRAGSFDHDDPQLGRLYAVTE